MESWPLTFQQLINEEGFGKQLGDTTIRSDMDVGPDKVRSRFTVGVDQYSCTIYLDYDQLQDFEDFYKTTLGNGTLTFSFNDPFTGSPAEFRFRNPPDIKPRGGRNFTVNMKWEKMP